MFGKWIRRFLMLIIILAILLFVGMAKYGWEIMGIRIQTSKETKELEKKAEKKVERGIDKIEQVSDEILDVIQEEGTTIGKSLKNQIDKAEDKIEEKLKEIKGPDEDEVTKEEEKKLDEIISEKSQQGQR